MPMMLRRYDATPLRHAASYERYAIICHYAYVTPSLRLGYNSCWRFFAMMSLRMSPARFATALFAALDTPAVARHAAYALRQRAADAYY